MRERRVGGYRFAQVSWASVLRVRLRALRAENGHLSLHELRSFKKPQPVLKGGVFRLAKGVKGLAQRLRMRMNEPPYAIGK